jgi:D-alanyl-D-alanine carboxypeptidase/D-alanyl-D-alanine-endopeptidase (penicillin-binding protein 4)
LTIVTNNLGEIKEWKEGDAVIKSLVQKYFDVDMGNALIIDGSGLSRYNRIQTKTMFSLLKKGYSVKEFVDALPRPGETDTTLEKRVDLLPTIRAKTGAMSGISCLCGYNINGNSVKAFTTIFNSFDPPLREMFKVQDKFINSQVK